MTPAARHPTADALRRAAHGQVSHEISRHVAACPGCRADVETLRALRSRRADAARDACPDALLLVALHRGEASEDERAVLGSHVAACASCAAALDVLDADAGAPAPPAEPSPLRSLSQAAREVLASLSAFELPAALTLNARGGTPAGGLADALEAVRAGRLQEAVEMLRQAIAGGEDDPAAAFHLGACLVALGDPEAALPHLAAAARSRRSLAEYAWCHAQALLLLGRGEEAVAELRRCARLAGPRAQAAREQVTAVAAALRKR